MALTMVQIKDAFAADMGVKWDANIHAFVQYYQAKLLEQLLAQQADLMNKLIGKVDELNANNI